jgi:hypothetical protein
VIGLLDCSVGFVAGLMLGVLGVPPAMRSNTTHGSSIVLSVGVPVS